MGKEDLIKRINSWEQFQHELSLLSNKDKGEAFELLVKIYFKINPIYQFYDEVWLFAEVPHKTLEFLGLPSHDLGIDLLAKNGNEYHAIQCKYHSDEKSSVTFKEVATFISLLESNKFITQGYICSSADLTSRNFNKLKTKPINLIMSDSWQNLDLDFFIQARRLFEGQKPDLKPFKPREHQIGAINAAENHFLNNKKSRGKLIFPCGSGKSLTGLWITEKLQSNATIVAVPSLSLVKQTLEVYLREVAAKKKRVKWLCICSDSGIGKNEDIVFYTHNLGIPCQTDPIYIENWIRVDIPVMLTPHSGHIDPLRILVKKDKLMTILQFFS